MSKVGRPRLVESPEEFAEKAAEYFEECADDEVPVTITGLALSLGFESRQSFYDYEKRPDFSYVVKRARLTVEHSYEARLAEPKPTGAIFALKNMGWSDRREVSGPNGGPIETRDLSDTPDEELAERARQLTNRVGALAANGKPSRNGGH